MVFVYQLCSFSLFFFLSVLFSLFGIRRVFFYRIQAQRQRRFERDRALPDDESLSVLTCLYWILENGVAPSSENRRKPCSWILGRVRSAGARETRSKRSCHCPGRIYIYVSFSQRHLQREFELILFLRAANNVAQIRSYYFGVCTTTEISFSHISRFINSLLL